MTLQEGGTTVPAYAYADNMPHSLIALGANVGERATTLDRALAALADLPNSRLVARSGWHETAPVGGPAGQQPFLNGAARLATTLDPRALFESLLVIETSLGRVRSQRWEARALDLDLLLYDQLVVDGPRLQLPHPRIECRRFVLDPAAEAAPWMIHPTSGWTIARLREQLTSGADVVAVAAETVSDASVAAQRLAEMSGQAYVDSQFAAAVRRGAPFVTPWSAQLQLTLHRRPKLILAVGPAGSDAANCRRILMLPATGPVIWLPRVGDEQFLPEAVAAVQSVWPDAAID